MLPFDAVCCIISKDKNIKKTRPNSILTIVGNLCSNYAFRDDGTLIYME